MSENGREYVLATARELYGRVVWSHKVHEKEREIWSGKSSTMNYFNVGLISATTVFAVISVTVEAKAWVSILTAILAAASTASVLWQTSFDPVGKENRHRAAAKELVCMREQLLLLLVRCNIGIEDTAHLQLSLESLTREVAAIYKFAPDTSPKAYASASASFNSGEMTLSDDEIDAFLPPRLRKNQSGGQDARVSR